MFKKIIIAVLILTVLGAGAAALTYQANAQSDQAASGTPQPLASNTTGNGQPDHAGNGQAVQDDQAVAAQGSEGQPWQASGTILAVDDYGFDLELEGGETLYVELGPPGYWQDQGITLTTGQQVTVAGTDNQGMIHATQVQFADGQILQVRSESGQPLWSSGAQNGQAGSESQGDGTHSPDPQAQVEAWVTLEGTLMSFQGGNMTMATAEGDLVAFQTGQPRFFAGQGVTFQVGDQISVLGFYEGNQFMAGEITQGSTSLRVMLRDPNGRPLWAGPGSGNGNNNGNSGNGNGNGGGNNGAGNGNHGKNS